MSFSRWYPVSSYFYDPAIQPTKPIQNLQAQQDAQFRKIPKGRYDTTYRREYLNFQQPNEKVNKQELNQYTLLPPISPNRSQSNQEMYQSQETSQKVPSIDYVTTEPPSQVYAQNYNPKNLPQATNYESYNSPRNAPNASQSNNSDNYLPREPMILSQTEETSLMQDIVRELGNYSSEELKKFYSELTTYDPNLTGSVHHMYITLVAMRCRVPLSEQLLRFVMCKFVATSEEPGKVNYEDMIKYLARCIGEKHYLPSRNAPRPQQQQQQQNQNTYDRSRMDPTDNFDPDEQAILRLLHENMREWDKTRRIDIDTLRKQFYDIDYMKKYTATQRQIEDILYKNRIPIQRSLIYQICEKYCKVAAGLYRWPAFVDFLENVAKTTSRFYHATPTINYTRGDLNGTNSGGVGGYQQRENEMDASDHSYRLNQLESLRKKVTEEERLDEIEKQIYNLQHLKQETKQRIDSRLGDAMQGESWFTRFMRLANAMYSHRVNIGIEFTLPRDEAKRLISAYNTVYNLNVPESMIEEGLSKCTRKGNVLIDDLLRVLSRVK